MNITAPAAPRCPKLPPGNPNYSSTSTKNPPSRSVKSSPEKANDVEFDELARLRANIRSMIGLQRALWLFCIKLVLFIKDITHGID